MNAPSPGDITLSKLSEKVPAFIYQFQQFPDGRSSFPFASDAIRVLYEVTPREFALSYPSPCGILMDGFLDLSDLMP
jgi:hypothetical protein